MVLIEFAAEAGLADWMPVQPRQQTHRIGYCITHDDNVAQ